MDGTTNDLLVDRTGGLPEIVDDGTAGYLHAPGLVAKVTASGATDGLTDALGSVRGTSDASGTLTGRRSYEAFGQTLSSSGTSLAFGFTGAPSDATGLVDLRARSLDPVSGRFLSADSVIPNAPGTQGYSPYAYVANNPMNWTDPTGHSVNLLAQDAATIMATQIGELMLASIAGCGIVALASGGVAAADCAAVAITWVFLSTMPLLICALTEGCMAVAMDVLSTITGQGSGGSDTQSTDAQDAVDQHPETPPEPKPEPKPVPIPLPPGLDDDSSACNQMIDIDGESRTHVQERHVEGMQLEKYRDKSYFFAWVAWEPLVMATEVFPAVKSPDNPDNCFRLAKAQVDIGVNDPLGANMTTPQFSVFTDADSGHLETAHPGLPRKHPWGDA